MLLLHIEAPSHLTENHSYRISASNGWIGLLLGSLSSTFLHTYMKWESGSSITKSAGRWPLSVIGIGSIYDIVEELSPSGLSNPGLAAKEDEKKKKNRYQNKNQHSFLSICQEYLLCQIDQIIKPMHQIKAAR